MQKLYLKQGVDSELKKVYVVTQVVNAIKPSIGDKLSSQEVKNFCGFSMWQVIIK